MPGLLTPLDRILRQLSSAPGTTAHPTGRHPLGRRAPVLSPATRDAGNAITPATSPVSSLRVLLLLRPEGNRIVQPDSPRAPLDGGIPRRSTHPGCPKDPHRRAWFPRGGGASWFPTAASAAPPSPGHGPGAHNRHSLGRASGRIDGLCASVSGRSGMRRRPIPARNFHR